MQEAKISDWMKSIMGLRYILDFYCDWKKITLVTPADKEENIKFYTEKCGFIVSSTEMDGNVPVAHFLLKR
jgi:hypothetical protein